jgi:hypothetical protein
MTGKEKVLAALNHQEAGKVPIDLGSTAVTGIHASCVAALRDYYGLEKRPVKVHEPYQMLGWIDDDLKEALGADVEGIYTRCTLFGFPNENWKPWRTPRPEVLVSEHFQTREDANGDVLIYPQGDLSAPPSGRMPKDGFFFDTIIRQPPIEEDRLDPEDNLEEFGPISGEDLQHFARELQRVKHTKRAIIATFGGTAFGDIACSRPFSKSRASRCGGVVYVHHSRRSTCNDL